MKLTQGADYGLAAVLYLAQKDETRRYPLDEISQTSGIPEEFLRKIVQPLVKAGIIGSFKGKGGGVKLARQPSNITVLEVIQPLGEKRGLVRCLRGEYCPRSRECAASGFWREIQERLYETLEKATIEDLIERRKVTYANGKLRKQKVKVDPYRKKVRGDTR
jgi:Rrf2 family protein